MKAFAYSSLIIIGVLVAVGFIRQIMFFQQALKTQVVSVNITPVLSISHQGKQ